jgi:hypothetical protein
VSLEETDAGPDEREQPPGAEEPRSTGEAIADPTPEAEGALGLSGAAGAGLDMDPLEGQDLGEDPDSVRTMGGNIARDVGA